MELGFVLQNFDNAISLIQKLERSASVFVFPLKFNVSNLRQTFDAKLVPKMLRQKYVKEASVQTQV